MEVTLLDKDRLRYLLPALLVLLVIINMFLWSNTRYLKEQITRLQGEMYGLRTQVTAEVTSIGSTVQRMHEESRWWTPATADFRDIDETSAVAEIRWQLREHRADSEVTLHYQPPGEQDFTSIPAEEKTDGYFAAAVPLDVPLEPLWHVELSRAEQDSPPARLAAEERVSQGQNEPRLRYYYSVQDGEKVLTSDISDLNLFPLITRLFDPLHLEVSLDGDSITVTLNETTTGTARFELRDVHLETRQSPGRTLEKWRLEPAGAEREYRLHAVTATPSVPYDALYVVAEYAEGLVAEKQLPLP